MTIVAGTQIGIAFMQKNVEGYAKDMRRKHMTYDVLHEEYLRSTDNPYGYTQFKAIIQEYEKNHDYKYHNAYEPGREMQFDFADSPNFSLSTVVGGILFPFSKLQNFYHFINQLVRKTKNYLNISRQSPKHQNSPESRIIPQITPKFERLIHLPPLQSTNNLHEILYHVLGILH